jgi:hypothetical protein
MQRRKAEPETPTAMDDGANPEEKLKMKGRDADRAARNIAKPEGAIRH